MNVPMYIVHDVTYTNCPAATQWDAASPVLLQQTLNFSESVPQSRAGGQRVPLSNPPNLVLCVVPELVELEGVFQLLVTTSHGVFQLAVPGREREGGGREERGRGEGGEREGGGRREGGDREGGGGRGEGRMGRTIRGGREN